MRHKLTTCLITILLALAGCSGGGGSSGNDDNVVTPDVVSNEPEGVNGKVSGSLFIGEHGKGWMLDFRTGDMKRIPGVMIGVSNESANLDESIRLSGSPVQWIR